VRRLTAGRGVDYVVECSGATDAVNEAARMLNRGGKICLAAFPHEAVPIDVAYLVRNNIYLYGIRARARARPTGPRPSCRRSDSTPRDPHPHVPARRPADRDQIRADRVEDAIKVVVKARGVASAQKVAAE